MWHMTADTRHNGRQAMLFHMFNVLVNGGTEGHIMTGQKKIKGNNKTVVFL